MFVVEDAWGYVEGNDRQYLRVFSREFGDLNWEIPTELAIDTSVPIVSNANGQAVTVALGTKGIWTTDSEGLSTNTTPPGPYFIYRVSLPKPRDARIHSVWEPLRS